MTLTPADPNFESRVRASFARQAFMATLGARLAGVAPGQVVIELPFRADLTQQHGFLHAGAVAAVMDSACGYAALTLVPPNAGVLTVEFKINLLAPAAASCFQAVGRVVRAGRTLTVCSAELRALAEASTPVDGRAIAVLQATIMVLHGRRGISD